MRKIVGKFYYFLSQTANNDLIDIWNYTYKEWGSIKAESYIRKIYKQLDILSQSPKAGKLHKNCEEEYRSFVVGKHIIFSCLSGCHLMLFIQLYLLINSTYSHQSSCD